MLWLYNLQGINSVYNTEGGPKTSVCVMSWIVWKLALPYGKGLKLLGVW